jgi:hypothetical protein
MQLNRDHQMASYIVSPFRKPKTAILKGLAGADIQCPICGNDDQNRFWVVTGLAATDFQGVVCAPCEDRAAVARG